MRLRYDKYVLTTDAARVAAELNIYKDLFFLQDRCSTQGDVIMSRWRKKSRHKREKISLTADPNPYPEQWLIVGHTWKNCEELLQ